MNELVTFTQFRKNYGAFPALQISKLTIPIGIHWLKGQNGSGKTTLLKCIAGLLPFSGDIFVQGRSAQKQRAAYRTQVSYGEAEPLYPGFLSAHDLLQFVAHTRRASSQQVDHLTEVLGLHSFLYQPCHTYSSGMLKKLSLALALLGTSALVLLDEPLITLDTATVQRLGRLIREQVSGQRSFLISSHQDLSDYPFSLTHTYEVKEKTVCQLD